MNAILAFWVAYVLTRPLGASIGDFLSQPKADGGLGLGTTVTSVIFLLTILAVVIFLSVTKVDRIDEDSRDEIILETPPSHVSHWLHVDLPQRIAQLGYPLVAVAATH